MTQLEYDSCRLPKRLSFKEREAALFVLVHGMSFEAAATVCGMRNEGDLDKVKAAVKLFEESLPNK